MHLFHFVFQISGWGPDVGLYLWSKRNAAPYWWDAGHGMVEVFVWRLHFWVGVR